METEAHLVPEPVALAYIAGMATVVLMIAVCYGIPALWWWWHDQHAEPTVDELLDLDTCDLCLVPLTEDIEAITCDAHRYCGDCDDASNRCTACSIARWEAMTEELA